MFDVNKFDGFRDSVLDGSCLGVVCLAHTYKPTAKPEHSIKVYQSVPDLVSHVGLIHHYLDHAGLNEIIYKGLKDLYI